MVSINNKFLFLGTGGEAGVPIHYCDCKMCRDARLDTRYVRRQPTNLLNYQGKNYFIDMGFPIIFTDPKFNKMSIEAIFLTHTHIAHTQGLYYLKWSRQHNLPVYLVEGMDLVDGFEKLVLSPSFLGPFHEAKLYKEIKINGMKVIPLELNHTVSTVGYYFETEDFSLAYLVDTKGLPEKTREFLSDREIDIVIIDAMYPPKWDVSDHNNLDEAVDILSGLEFDKAFLTHISHMYGSNEALEQIVEKKSREINRNILVAYDNMYVELFPPFKTGFIE